jgi:hypothetical protein
MRSSKNSSILVVMGIDPGETTGVCIWKGRVREGGSVWKTWEDGEVLYSGHVDCHDELAGAKSVFHKWRRHANVLSSERVWTIERWVGAGPAASNDWAQRVTWALLGYRAGWVDGSGRAEPAVVEWRSANEAKTFASDARLKRHGLWVPGWVHARDSTRLAIITVAGRC